MDKQVQQFLNPKDFDTLSQQSRCHSTSQLTNIRKKQVKVQRRQIKSPHNSQVDKISQFSQPRFNENVREQFNSFMKKHVNTYESMYSSDYNEKKQKVEIKAKAKPIQINNLMNNDENTSQNHKSKLNQIQNSQKVIQQQEIDNLQRMKYQSCNELNIKEENNPNSKMTAEQEMIINYLSKYLERCGNRVDIDKLVNENQDYIMHVFCKCKCFTCNCGLCKCNYMIDGQIKFRLKNSIKSSYKRDFLGKNRNSVGQLNDLPECDQRTYDINYNEPFHQQIDLQSTQRQEFTKKRAEAVKPCNEKKVQKSGMKTLKSNYNANYVDYQDNRLYRPNVKAVKSIIEEMPLYGNTVYNQSFMDFYRNEYMNQTFKNGTNSFKNSKFEYDQQPILPQFRLKDEQYKSTNTFYNSQLGRPSLKIPKRNQPQPYVMKNTFQPQMTYKSTFANDFKGNKNPLCEGNKKVDVQEMKNEILDLIHHRQH